MDRGAVVWLIIFALAAILFFGIAAVVAVKGLGDLQKLLRFSKRDDASDDAE